MKKKTKFKEGGVYHLLMYYEDSSPILKRFSSTEEMGKFIDEFNKKYPESEANRSGYWTDFCITEVAGKVHFFTDGVELD